MMDDYGCITIDEDNPSAEIQKLKYFKCLINSQASRIQHRRLRKLKTEIIPAGLSVVASVYPGLYL